MERRDKTLEKIFGEKTPDLWSRFSSPYYFTFHASRVIACQCFSPAFGVYL